LKGGAGTRPLHKAGHTLLIAARTADPEMEPPGGGARLNRRSRFADQRIGGQGASWTINVGREQGR